MLALNWRWTTLLYWLWANVFVVVLTTQFWFLVNDRFDPRQAKRLVGFLGSGGILGGIAGGPADRAAGPARPSGNLLYAAAALLAVGAPAVTVFFRRLDRLPGRRPPGRRPRRPRPASSTRTGPSAATPTCGRWPPWPC